jgi:hypothetical protein
MLGLLFLPLWVACGDSATGAGGAAQGGGGSAPVGGAPPEGGAPPAGGAPSEGGAGGGVAAGPTVALVVDPTTMSAGDVVEAQVTVTDFVLEEGMGQPNEAGHGHFHIYLDNATGGNYLLAGQTPTVNLTIPANTTAGPHTLRVSLGQNNHAPVSPAVEAIVDITVE